MALIIKDRNVVTDPWLRLELNTDGSFPPVPPAGDIIVPLAMWQAQRVHLLVRPGRLGVWLDSHEDPATIAEDLKLVGVVAVNFPKFGDGRGYSTARLLRERYGYKGELRAIGDVIRDVLFQLASCGFNAFALRKGEDLLDALSAFHDFSDSYQATVEEPLPLFRRRHLVSPDAHGVVVGIRQQRTR
jgi:uncharacterized protein (DUF934 family)